MPTVSAFGIAGLDLRFYTNDHEPPHFHAIKRGDWVIRVFFTQCTKDELVYGQEGTSTKAPTSAVRKALLEQVLAHQFDLMVEWEATRPG